MAKKNLQLQGPLELQSPSGVQERRY